jgi:hypothetical protein
VSKNIDRFRFDLILASCFFSSIAIASTPDCTSKDSWPSVMTFVHLKNAGLIDNNSTDFDKTKVSRLASEKSGKETYRQIHLVQYFKKNGEVISSIAVNDVSAEECSMSGVDVYVIEKRLGDYSTAR